MALRRDIDIALLRAFLAVVETGGMTAAGRLLNLTQAAVSQQIRRLEELLGNVLFDRSSRQLELTVAGERFVGQARRLVELNDEVFATMTAPEFSGEVRLGVPHDIISAFMPPILRAFSQAWPQVRVTLLSSTTAELLEALSRGEADVTLTTELEPHAGGVLLRDPLIWAGAVDGRAYLKEPLPVALGSPTCGFRGETVRALTKAGRDWTLMCHTGSIEPINAILEADIAVAPMLSLAVPSGLRALPGDCGLPPLPPFYVNLHSHMPVKSPLAAELERFIRDAFATRYRQAA